MKNFLSKWLLAYFPLALVFRIISPHDIDVEIFTFFGGVFVSIVYIVSLIVCFIKRKVDRLDVTLFILFAVFHIYFYFITGGY